MHIGNKAFPVGDVGACGNAHTYVLTKTVRTHLKNENFVDARGPDAERARSGWQEPAELQSRSILKEGGYMIGNGLESDRRHVISKGTCQSREQRLG
jgi:hypothetical protein